MNHTYYSHGKLLFTSEYLVLDGAKALAVPTKRGQKLEVKEMEPTVLHWKSILEDGTVWIEHTFQLPLNAKTVYTDPLITRLHEILTTAQHLNPDFLSNHTGYDAISTLEFHKDWGLGSSSTLIANIASWAAVDPYKLLDKTFGGSGYDIACATAAAGITFQKTAKQPSVLEVAFTPDFTDLLFFVHLNRKQNSRESINHYRSLDQQAIKKEVAIFSELTERFLKCTDIDVFEKLLIEHEERLSHILKTPTIKSQFFADYPRAIKSLGGWGGDFILVVGSEGDRRYFKDKGFKTIVPYQEMIL